MVEAASIEERRHATYIISFFNWFIILYP